MARISQILLLIVLLSLPTFAQNQASAPTPAFEVASVKPGDPNDRKVAIEINPGGRLTTTNMNLKNLIEFAYDVREFQISGGPDWLDSEKYNIEAKPDVPIQGDPEDTQLRLMLQTLLVDRFGLRLHRETKELPVYSLIIARDGPKLSKSKEAETGPSCNMSPRGRLTCQRLPLGLLAEDLSRQLGRKVLDRTGLKGRYDLTLEWAPSSGEGETPIDPDGPSIFTALQEQLGLKLESEKGPVEMLFVDQAERPSEN